MSNVTKRRLGLIAGLLLLSNLAACELIVEFDRTKIPDGGTDSGVSDAPVVETGAETSTDASDDAGDDDAATDAAGDADDGGSDAGEDGPQDASDDALEE